MREKRQLEDYFRNCFPVWQTFFLRFGREKRFLKEEKSYTPDADASWNYTVNIRYVYKIYILKILFCFCVVFPVTGLAFFHPVMSGDFCLIITGFCLIISFQIFFNKELKINYITIFCFSFFFLLFFCLLTFYCKALLHLVVASSYLYSHRDFWNSRSLELRVYSFSRSFLNTLSGISLSMDPCRTSLPSDTITQLQF